ncbi:hypothetical protein [Azospirillum sp. A29]|uniref:hypothetical protein n=1 Tax=unclassified Azospirillum TaxID=2630922 RepID=UPI00366F85E2
MALPYTVEVAHRQLPRPMLVKVTSKDPATAADQAACSALEILLDDDDLPDEDDTGALDMALAEQEHELDLLCDDSICRVWPGHHDTLPDAPPVYSDNA